MDPADAVELARRMRAAVVEETSRRRWALPALRPGKLLDSEPSFYIGNHLSIVPDRAVVSWPSYAEDLDFEIELACVLRRPLRDASENDAIDAIGGFLIINDLTARDEQWRQLRSGLFGPVGKAKSFATAMSSIVISPDEVLPRLNALTGRVFVDGEQWTETSTSGMKHDVATCIAYASRGETLLPGEIFSFGTLPAGSGVEIDRWIQPGQEVRLELDHVGSLTTHIGSRATVPPAPRTT